MTIETYIAFFIASNIVCLMPGPTMLLVIHYTMLYGKQSARYSLFGVMLGDITAIAISFSIIGTILALSPNFFEILKVIAGFYIIFLGIKELTTKADGFSTEQRPAARSILRHLFIITAFNPKTILFFTAFFPQFISANEYTINQLLIMAVSFVAIGAFYTLIVQALAQKISHYIKQPAIQRSINIIVGTVLCIIGLLTMVD